MPKKSTGNMHHILMTALRVLWYIYSQLPFIGKLLWIFKWIMLFLPASKWISLFWINCYSAWLGTIQVLRHQRGGWVGWPNDDVSKNIQGKKLCLRAQKKRLEFSLKNLLEIYLSFEDITDQFNSSDWLFFW
jgi:hypothetical protein